MIVLCYLLLVLYVVHLVLRCLRLSCCECCGVASAAYCDFDLLLECAFVILFVFGVVAFFCGVWLVLFSRLFGR